MEENTPLSLEPIVPKKSSATHTLSNEDRALLEACANKPNRFTNYKETQDSRPLIKKLIFMGDSLSDRGTLFNRKLFGLLPMSFLAGIQKTSPDGRFTNGLTWDDFFISSLGGNFEIQTTKGRLRSRNLGNDDVSDALIAADRQVKHHNHNHKKTSAPKPKRYFLSEDDIVNGELRRMGPEIVHNNDEFQLDNDRTVIYHQKPWARNYTEGGLMAYDYSCKLVANIKQLFTRNIMSTLEDKRDLLFAYDKKHGVSEQEKKETLIVEWSGANDLITVNDRPTRAEVDKAIASRIKNMQKLIEAGYTQFALFNLPDLSLTPRYQARSQKEKDNARDCSDYFNAQLAKSCAEMAEKYPYCNIKVFDVNAPFKEMYQSPEKYGFDPAKLRQPYTTSKDFKNSNGLSPAQGYFFWDDVHPSADAHSWLGSKFYDQIIQTFRFVEPSNNIPALAKNTEQELLARYRVSYAQQLKQDRSRFFGALRTRSNIDFEHASFQQVVHHALHGGTRTRNTLRNLGLFDQRNKPVMEIPAVAKAVLQDKKCVR